MQSPSNSSHLQPLPPLANGGSDGGGLQQQQSQHQKGTTTATTTTTTITATTNKTPRPLSISSISSAASTNSSSSSNSSTSSGIQSSLTRNSSLNYSQEFRNQKSYLASIESLDSCGCSPSQHQLINACSLSSCDHQHLHSSSCNHHHDEDDEDQHHNHHHYQDTNNLRIELALKDLNLGFPRNDAKNNTTTSASAAATRAAVLAAGESQRRGFGTTGDNFNRTARINRSLHASLRYDKNTAYRIHLMTNARALLYANKNLVNNGVNREEQQQQQQCCESGNSGGESSSGNGISRNNSSTSSDSGHTRASFRPVGGRRLSCQMCRCYQLTRAINQPTADSPMLPKQSTSSTATSDTETIQQKAQQQHQQLLFNKKAATLDGGALCQRNIAIQQQQVYNQHLPNCHYANNIYNQPSPTHHHHHHQRPKRASPKLQQSPSSVSSHSNTSSMFRDDGFEDDLTSTASEHSSSAVFQNSQRASSMFYHNNHNLQHHQHHRRVAYHQRHLESELSSPSITQRVVNEIIETERSYVDDLEQIVSGYLCYLRDILKQHKELFSNLEDIYKFNKDFLFQLEECYLNPGAVAACFVENALKFDVYTHYCTMYPQVVLTLTQLMADPNTAQLLKERQLELDQSLPLGAYLLKPVQRILKYHILFKSLIKYSADDTDESVADKDRELINEAFSVMTNIACHINEMKKKHEHAIRVQELQGLLCGWEGPDLTTLGELILEDTFKLCNRQKSTRHLLLFDNILLITKKKRDGSLCYKSHIECSNLMLIETIEGQPLVFHTVPFDSPKALAAFQADNLDKKRDWCLQMKEVIIKSFEVKIPTHVRDLLMSLTKGNNASDANPSTASLKSSPMSSSEVAKAVRAPDYLEKKRNKQQDKKK